MVKKHHRPRRTSWLLEGLLLAMMVAVSGCKTLNFYTQAIAGQCRIVLHEQPIQKLLLNPNTPETLKQRLSRLQDLRQFAEAELKLRVDGHYQKYVDLGRPFVVWNVEATPEFSMQARAWWYPLVGSLEYRGYFSLADATNYAAFLRGKGYDVAVGGVQAYSTLGWFKDPVLNTFIFESDAGLAEIIFHELSHQRVFANGDTDFNEAFATTVGQEGVRRWLGAQENVSALKKYENYLQRNAQFVQLVIATQQRLEGLYGEERDGDGKIRTAGNNHHRPAPELRQAKQQIYADLKRQFEGLRAKWGGPSDYDDWFDHEINNAHLNSIATYYDLVPGFERLLDLNGGDLERFYSAAAELAKRPKAERHERLDSLSSPLLESRR